MPEEAYALSKAALDDLTTRLVNLEAQYGDTNSPNNHSFQGKFISAGITSAGGATYPPSTDDPTPNVFYVLLGSLSFVETGPGNISPNFSAYSPEKKELACSLSGYVPSGTIVIVQKLFGQYYIIQTNIDDICKYICETCDTFAIPDGGC